MIKGAIIEIVNKEDLSYDGTYAVMNEIMSGESSQVQNMALLAAVSTKSAKAETTDKIPGYAAAICVHAMKVEYDKPALEIVGTDGNGVETFSISSIPVLVAVVAGIKVAKHGNHAASPDCGSADFLEASGININQDPELCKKLLNETNIYSLFVQHYHVSTKYIGAIRREFGFRTVLNILEPLTNPASSQCFVLGVYDEYLVWPLANVLRRLGVERAFVVYGQDEMDKISVNAPSTACELRDDSFHSATARPEGFELQHSKKEELVDGDPAENMRIAREILSGRERGTHHAAVLLNAGTALYIGDKTESLKEDVQLAGRLIDEGKVPEAYEKYVCLSNGAVE